MDKKLQETLTPMRSGKTNAMNGLIELLQRIKTQRATDAEPILVAINPDAYDDAGLRALRHLISLATKNVELVTTPLVPPGRVWSGPPGSLRARLKEVWDQLPTPVIGGAR